MKVQCVFSSGSEKINIYAYIHIHVPMGMMYVCVHVSMIICTSIYRHVNIVHLYTCIHICTYKDTWIHRYAKIKFTYIVYSLHICTYEYAHGCNIFFLFFTIKHALYFYILHKNVYIWVMWMNNLWEFFSLFWNFSICLKSLQNLKIKIF